MRVVAIWLPILIGLSLAKPTIKPGDALSITCIDRNIDTGEHKFDSDKNIIYRSFPKCQESNSPLSFQFLKDESVNCTFPLLDETFHLFQLYIHQDSPYTCRLQLSETETIPLVLNLRGDIQESHLDIDPTLSVLFFARSSESTQSSYQLEHGVDQTSSEETTTAVPSVEPASAVAFSLGFANKNRYIIGDYITLQFETRWYTGTSVPQYSSFRYTATTTLLYCAATMIGTFVVSAGIFYGMVFPRRLRQYGAGEFTKLD
jgi:hypothetical protein